MALEPIIVTPPPLSIPCDSIEQRVFSVIECMDVRHMFFLRFGKVSGLEGWCPRITIVPCLTGQHDFCAVFIDATIESLPPTQDSLPPVPQFFQGEWWEHWTSSTVFSRRDAAVYGDRFDELVRLRFTNAMHKTERWRKVSIASVDQINIYDDDNLPELPELDAAPDLIATG